MMNLEPNLTIRYQNMIKTIWNEILNKDASMKQRYLGVNQGRFMRKDLYKTIMKGSRLRNKFLSDTSEISQKQCKKQRNFCANNIFTNLDVNAMSDNKKFRQIVKPFLSNKVKAKTAIKLVEDNEMIDDEIEIAKLFNEDFVKIFKKLRIFTKEQSAVSTENSLSQVEIDIAKCRNHPSVTAISDKIEKPGKPTFWFRFHFV